MQNDIFFNYEIANYYGVAKTHQLWMGEFMARRSRAERRSSQEQTSSLSMPFIQRRLPYFDVLTEEELVQIEAHVDWMIENVGVAFRDDPVALDIWRKAGIEPQGEHGDLIKADAQWDLVFM